MCQVLSFNESPNQWGIPEPCEKAAKRMENALTESVDLDVLIVPGMAYDRHGRRCGHGGGFYDRYIEKLQRARIDQGLAPATLLGICLCEQLVEAVVTAPHDILVDMVVTPSEIIHVAENVQVY